MALKESLLRSGSLRQESVITKQLPAEPNERLRLRNLLERKSSSRKEEHGEPQLLVTSCRIEHGWVQSQGEGHHSPRGISAYLRALHLAQETLGT